MSGPQQPRHPDDRALAAVRRVRDAREQDSRFGLQQSLRVLADRETALERASDRRAQARPFAQGSPSEFVSHLTEGARLAALEQAAAAGARDGRLVAEESRGRWQQDRRRSRVVSRLLERRAEERAVERGRLEARELDDLASQAWQRGQASPTPSDPEEVHP